MAEIYALRDAMTPQQRENPVWDVENSVSWNAFFTERRERQLNDSRPLPPPPEAAPARGNSDSQKAWWSVPRPGQRVGTARPAAEINGPAQAQHAAARL